MSMRSKRNKTRKGQALLYAVLCMGAVLSIIALALDAGWAFFAAKRAQTAVDAAALAAIAKTQEMGGATANLSCGTAAQCQAAASACPTGGNLAAACAYAARNGVTHGGDNQRQSLFVAAGNTSNAPGIPNVPVSYWVQATSQHALPQWFSRLFSSQGMTASAKATAALWQADADASIYLLNRANDCFVSALGIVGLICGEDLLMLGGNRIDAEKPIYMSSANHSGIGIPKIAAGTVIGAATVRAPRTYLMEDGGVQGLGFVDWQSAPRNGFPDGRYFTDPMAGKGQPPVPANLPNRPVVGGVIAGSLLPGNPTVLPPGHYYSVTPNLPLLPSRATGLPIVVTGNVVFSDGAGCGGFCEYVFHGGLVTGVLSTVTFSPGRYVFAGAQPVAGGPGVGLTVGLNSTIKDMTPLQGSQIGPPADAGEIFIFTDSHYPGLQTPVALLTQNISLPQARAGITGTGLFNQIVLHGLNRNHPSLPAELRDFAPALIWQDQANTTIRYTGTGLVDRACGSPCDNILSVPGSQQMILTASGNGTANGTHLYGTIYGPRESWLTVVGLLPGDTIEGPLQIITGALQMTLNSRLNLRALPDPPKMMVASLIR